MAHIMMWRIGIVMQREGSSSTLNEWGAGQQALERTTLIQNATAWKWIDDYSPVTEIYISWWILQSMSSFRYYSYFHCGRFTSGNHPNCSLAFLLDIQMQTDWKEDTLKNRKLRYQAIKALIFQVWPFFPQMKGVATSETPKFIATNPTKHMALIFNIGVHMKNFIEY